MLELTHVWQALVSRTSETPSSLAGRPLHLVVVDSRAAQPGSLFVALRGEKTDGHLYLQDAFDRGAIAAIAQAQALTLGLDATLITEDGRILHAAKSRPELARSETDQSENRFFDNPSGRYVFIVPDSLAGLQRLAAFWRAQMPAIAIGITGSIGKTTTKESVANVLAQRYLTLRSEGNLNNEIGLPLTLLRLTPEHQRVVLEMGMYALGEIANLCRLVRPRIGVVTNVGPTHLGRLGTIDRIAQAKAELVQALPPAAEGGVAILNTDDPLVRAMAGQTPAQVFTYGLSEVANLWADEIVGEGLEGIHFRFHYGAEAFHVRLPMLGQHSVHTALSSAAVGLVAGLSWPEIIAGLQDVQGQLRLVVVHGLRDTTLIDDTYNASPASMLAALNLLTDIARGQNRTLAVLGDMYELGSYEEAGHRIVGGRAAQVVHKLVTVGERARWIAEEALATGMKAVDIHPTAHNQDAVAVLQGLLRPGDIVLIKGSRTMEMEDIVDALSTQTKPGS